MKKSYKRGKYKKPYVKICSECGDTYPAANPQVEGKPSYCTGKCKAKAFRKGKSCLTK